MQNNYYMDTKHLAHNMVINNQQYDAHGNSQKVKVILSETKSSGKNYTQV